LNLALDRNRDRDKPGKEGDDFVARRHKEFFVADFAGTPVLTLDTGTSQQASVCNARRMLWNWLSAAARQDEPSVDEPVLRLRSFDARARQNLVVEFIGVTGVGKSTLIAAVRKALSDRGLHVADAEQAILAYHRLGFIRCPGVCSALTFLLGLPAFTGFLLTRDGRRLTHLAITCIVRGMGNLWIGANLLRNFVKRIGTHRLLESLRSELADYDLLIWDEGVVHAAHNLFVHSGTGPRDAEIEQFGRLVPKPDRLIWVTAPAAQSVQVVLNRGHSRVHATADAAQAFVEHARTTFMALSRVDGLHQRIQAVDNTALAADQDAAIHARAQEIGEYLVRQLRHVEPALPRRELPVAIATPSAQIV
jgi:hypothetical protein